MSRRMRNQGFTLLEMSVVLGIIAVVVIAGMNVGSDAIKATDRVATQEKLATVKQALDTYARANGYLPCPADRSVMPSGNASAANDTVFGMEQRSGTACTTNAPGLVSVTVSAKTAYIGTVPVRTLGLPDAYAADAWGNKLTYAVSALHVANPSNYSANDGPLTVTYGDRNGTNYAISSATNRSASPPTIAAGAGATYVVVSHGADGRGAFPLAGTSVPTSAVCVPAGASPPPCVTAADNNGCNDIENCDDANLIFYDTQFNDNIDVAVAANLASAGSSHWFDDFVVWGSNSLQRSPIATATSGCSGSCESWCAQCTANFPSPSVVSGGAPGGMTNPVLCQKFITSTSPCYATCFWGGTINAGTYANNYVGCP